MAQKNKTDRKPAASSEAVKTKRRPVKKPIKATVQKQGGGEIDWMNTEYKREVEEGLFDGPSLSAFLSAGPNGEWTVVEQAVGPTDVPWDHIWERHEDVPCALFPVQECHVAE